MGLKDLVSKKPTTLYFDGSYYDTIDELLADCQIDKADYNNERSAHRDWEPVNVVDNLVKNKKGVLPSKIKAIKAAEEKAAALKAAAEAKAAQEARTFGDAMASVADAVSSQWMTTFELIFGNYDDGWSSRRMVEGNILDYYNLGANSLIWVASRLVLISVEPSTVSVSQR